MGAMIDPTKKFEEMEKKRKEDNEKSKAEVAALQQRIDKKMQAHEQQDADLKANDMAILKKLAELSAKVEATAASNPAREKELAAALQRIQALEQQIKNMQK